MKIVAFAGSARTGSLNAALIATAARAAGTAGADVTLLNMREHELPLYDGDLEVASGLPEPVRALKRILHDADAFLIAAPEYNGGITPLLKNVIDWASRGDDSEDPPLNPWGGKTAALFAASPGPLGGIRALPMVRQILTNVGVVVIPGDVAVGQASFDADGTLESERLRQRVEGHAAALVRFGSPA